MAGNVTTTDEKSGCIIISPKTGTKSAPNPKSVETSRIRCPRLSKNAAAAKRVATRQISEGCIEKKGSTNHEREPRW